MKLIVRPLAIGAHQITVTDGQHAKTHGDHSSVHVLTASLVMARIVLILTSVKHFSISATSTQPAPIRKVDTDARVCPDSREMAKPARILTSVVVIYTIVPMKPIAKTQRGAMNVSAMLVSAASTGRVAIRMAERVLILMNVVETVMFVTTTQNAKIPLEVTNARVNKGM